MRLARISPWTWSTVALAASLALGISWCIQRSPLTLYDGLGPILDARRTASIGDMFESAWHSSGYWRPLRMTQIKMVVDLSAEDPTAAFKGIHVALTIATFLLFATWVRPRTLPEFAGGAIALMILAGHHAFFILFSEAYPINHFLEIVALTLVIASVARGEPRWWKDLLAALLLAIGALTIESGLLIGVAAVVCWLVGWRGISWRGVVGVLLVVGGYFWLRVLVLEVSSPGLDERATGWWLTRLEPEELVARFSQNPLPLYVYNVFASFLDVMVSEPRGGVWEVTRRWLEDDLRPWMVVQVVSSVLITGAMLVALPSALARWHRRTLDDRDRFVLVAFALVAANSALSFGYVKDEVLSVGAVFYAAGAFAVLARVSEYVSAAPSAAAARPLRLAATAVLVCASVLWSSRAVATLFSLQASAYKVASDWAQYSLERELPDDWSFEPTRRTFLLIRERNIRSLVPHPVFTKQHRVDRYLEIR